MRALIISNKAPRDHQEKKKKKKEGTKLRSKECFVKIIIKKEMRTSSPDTHWGFRKSHSTGFLYLCQTLQPS